ncbi:MAG: hypothetical protein ACYSOS_06535, partial [Planctomycetota bacterium]
NTRDIPIDIEITWNMGTDAWELTYVDPASTAEDAITYKRHDKNRARYTMTVQARSEKIFWHTIRKYRQKRIETYVEKQKREGASPPMGLRETPAFNRVACAAALLQKLTF